MKKIGFSALMAVSMAGTVLLWSVAYDALAYSFTQEAQFGYGVSISRTYGVMFIVLSGIPAMMFLAAFRGYMDDRK